MHIPELSPEAYAAEMHTGVNVRSVGWLGRKVPRTGEIPEATLDALHLFAWKNWHDDHDLGFHRCEICGESTSRTEFWVECPGVRYVLPMMVFHYIEAHEYLPPDEFLLAVQQKIVSEKIGQI